MKTIYVGVLVFLMFFMRMTFLAHASGDVVALYPPDILGGSAPGTQTPAAGHEEKGGGDNSVTYRSYGLEILAVDAASIALPFMLATVTESELAALPLLGLVGGSSIVHAVHGNTGSAVISPLLRAGLPMLGFVAGAAGAAGCSGELCGLGPALGGFLVGAGTAILIDWTVLARERVEPAPTQGLSIAPSMSAGPDSLAFGLAGRF